MKKMSSPKRKVQPEDPILTQGQMARVWRLHDALARKQLVNSRTMKTLLGGYSRRTLLRDIEFMTLSLNMPIAFDHRRKTYYYTDAVTHLPVLTVSAAEMQALTTAQAVLSQVAGDPLAAKVQSALMKISRLIGINAFKGAASSTVKIMGAVQSHHANFAILEDAILRRQAVQFHYRKTGQDASTRELRRVHPHHCAMNKGRWYLAAFDPKRGAMRTFALTRMDNLKAGQGQFERQHDFNPDTYFSGFGIMTGTTIYHVEIEFDRWGADLLEGVAWHTTQKIKPLGDGKILLTMDLPGLDEVTNWLMSWGAHAKVKAPAELREKVLATANAVSDLYQG
jgi:proteasome accessory factor B